jgi:hypothetical protein
MQPGVCLFFIRSSSYHRRMEVQREELVEIIAFALWRSIDLRPRKRNLDDARVWAREVVKHLELCGIDWTRGPPTPPHRIP